MEGGLHFSYFKENAIDRSNINKGNLSTISFLIASLLYMKTI
jgi:hypothetical protein